MSDYGTYGISVSDTLTTDSEWDTPVYLDIWINVQGDGTYASHAEANFTFEMTISQACQTNVVTCASTDYVADFSYEIPIAQASAAATPVPSTSTCSSSVVLSPSGDCVLDTTLEGWLEATKEWVQVASGTITSDFDFLVVGTLDEANRVVEVQTTDRTTYNNPSSWAFRWKTDDRLSHADGGTVYQTFNITLNYECYDDVVAIDNTMDNDGDRITIDEATAVTLASSYLGTNSGCDWTAALFLYDESLEEYVAFGSHADGPLFAIDTATSIVTVLVDTLDTLSGGVIVGSQSSFVEYSV